MKGNQSVCMHVEEGETVKMTSGEWRKIFLQNTWSGLVFSPSRLNPASW